jgi:chemotaxis protein MotB
MLKKMLVVALAVSLFGITGCPELKTLRQQNANLKTQLAESQQALNDANSSLTTVTTMRDKYKDQLALAQSESGRMSGVIKQLQDQQASVEKQRADLAALVKEYAGINVEERGEGNFIVMENEILFDPGKIELKDKAKAALDKVANYLVNNPGVPVRIDGHSDAVPIHFSQWQDNYELSAMRAHSVMKYLISKGVEPERMYIVGFGPNRPRVQPPQPEAPMAANRRVEILLVPQGARSVSDILKDFVKE